MVRVIVADDVIVEVPRDLALEMESIRNVVEDTGSDADVPAPNVSAEILARVVAWCAYHKNHNCKPPIEAMRDVWDPRPSFRPPPTADEVVAAHARSDRRMAGLGRPGNDDDGGLVPPLPELTEEQAAKVAIWRAAREWADAFYRGMTQEEFLRVLLGADYLGAAEMFHQCVYRLVRTMEDVGNDIPALQRLVGHDPTKGSPWGQERQPLLSEEQAWMRANPATAPPTAVVVTAAEAVIAAATGNVE
jgi:hypothetical protein